MRVFMCDACGTDTDEGKLKHLHTHGPGQYSGSEMRPVDILGRPHGYRVWEVCGDCYNKAVASLEWYREYRSKQRAGLVA